MLALMPSSAIVSAIARVSAARANQCFDLVTWSDETHYLKLFVGKIVLGLKAANIHRSNEAAWQLAALRCASCAMAASAIVRRKDCLFPHRTNYLQSV
jgi:hypothetical protein